LQRYQEALASYDKAIAIQPNKHEAYYNKACTYALQNNTKLAVENLQKAIKLFPGKYDKLAKTDSDFAKIRSNKQFQELIQ
jgi:tetratricopeptide (TPR) repeat protein